MTLRFLLITPVLAIALLLTACGDDDSPSPNSRAALKAVATLPVNGSTGVNVNATPSVTFNKGLREPVPEGSVTLVSPQGPVAISHSYDPGNFTLRLEPDAPLAWGTAFTAEVAGLTAADGAALSAPIRWSFTTVESDIPVIEVASHTDGQNVYGARTITLNGTVGGATPVTAVTVMLNGTATQTDLDGNAFSAQLHLEDRANTVSTTAFNAGGLSASTDLTLTYPYVRLATHQPAELVIGRPDFTSTVFTETTAQSIQQPGGRPLFYNGILYLPDSASHRVVGYFTLPSTWPATADFVLGEAAFTTNNGGTSDWAYRQPHGIAARNGTFAVADTYNNRVLLYSEAPATTAAPAQVVVGQSTMGVSGSSCASNRLKLPEDVMLAGGKLIVADTDNHRVLVWNQPPTTNGAAAHLVLGQSGKSSCNANRGGSVTAGTLHSPRGVWSDGTRLFIADTGNNRILVWNTFPTADGQEADFVLGQGDVESSTAATTRNGLNAPRQLHGNGNQLFVADTGNHRILVWNALPTSNGAQPDHVLGQENFTGGSASTTARTFNSPAGVFAGSDFLLVGDRLNNRYLLFSEP